MLFHVCNDGVIGNIIIMILKSQFSFRELSVSLAARRMLQKLK